MQTLNSYTFRWKGKLLHLDSPKVMGILNCTPDSFYSESRKTDFHAIKTHIERLVSEGADWIDVGGMSSKPGSSIIHPNQEWERIADAIQYIRSEYPDMPISVDTLHSETAGKACALGVALINDISAATFDSNMLSTVRSAQVGICLMHMQGTPETMQIRPEYQQVTAECLQFLQQRLDAARLLGICDVWVDPGFGFGKTLEQNYTLLAQLDTFHMLECPILVGLSRKSMIYKLLNIEAETSLMQSQVAHTFALQKGAHILRVHDVHAARQTIQMWNMLKSVENA